MCIEEVESNVTETLSRLKEYYKRNQLPLNSAKTQTCLFHLNNRRGKRTANNWEFCLVAALQYCPNYTRIRWDTNNTIKNKSKR